MKKLDLRKDLKAYYNPPVKFQIIDIPRMRFLMIDGAIEPNRAPGDSPAFEVNVAAMYGAAYTLKFMFKQRPDDPIDYPVMPLEGLWGLQDVNFDIRKKDNWNYKLMIMVPDVVTPEHFAKALESLRKKRGDLPEFAQLRVEDFEEGCCVQTMFVGPYDDEPPVVEAMHAFAHEQGYALQHNHHEIYLGDPRRADPSKLKTVLRHPVAR